MCVTCIPWWIFWWMFDFHFCWERQSPSVSVWVSTPCKHLWHTCMNATGELTKHSWVFPHKGPPLLHQTHLPRSRLLPHQSGKDFSSKIFSALSLEFLIYIKTWMQIKWMKRKWIWKRNNLTAHIFLAFSFPRTPLYKDLEIWEYNSSPALIATPRLFECFEMRAP